MSNSLFFLKYAKMLSRLVDLLVMWLLNLCRSWWFSLTMLELFNCSFY